MATKISSLKCNRFGGIRRINATFANELISASDLQNVELFNTGINSGVGIRTTKGNTAVCKSIPTDEKIINLFESVQGNTNYCFVYTENSAKGKIYSFDINTQSVTLLKDNMTVTGQCCGLDIAQGWSDLFIFSNGEELLSIEMSAEEKIKMMNLVDMDDRQVKGLGLINYDNRLWIFNGNVLWYSVQENVYDFSTSDAQIKTSAGYIEYVKNITAITPY